jgi:hypothetical protein
MATVNIFGFKANLIKRALLLYRQKFTAPPKAAVRLINAVHPTYSGRYSHSPLRYHPTSPSKLQTQTDL